MKKIKVAIIETGGTIVSEGKSSSQMTGYELGNRGISSLLGSIPSVSENFEIICVPFCNIGSSNITLQNWIDLSRLLNSLKDEEYDGFVITHGTDTMEETAFFLNLTVKTDKPVVMTGSMRPSTAVSADGPLNLLNAVRIAGSKDAYGKGVLVALNGRIFAARDVSKTNTVAVETFDAPNSGPLGYIVGDDLDFLTESVKPHTVSSCFSLTEDSAEQEFPRVDIIFCHGDQDGILLEAALKAGAKGVVLAATGNGSVPKCMDKIIDQYPQCVFVRASRTGSGPVTPGVFRWQEAGIIPAGTLNPQKARILLQLSLDRFGQDKERIRTIFKTY